MTTRWGRIGTEGQSLSKSFADPAEATKEHDRLVAEKTKKGYRLVMGGAKAAPAAKSVAAAKKSSAGAGSSADPAELIALLDRYWKSAPEWEKPVGAWSNQDLARAEQLLGSPMDETLKAVFISGRLPSRVITRSRDTDFYAFSEIEQWNLADHDAGKSMVANGAWAFADDSHGNKFCVKLNDEPVKYQLNQHYPVEQFRFPRGSVFLWPNEGGVKFKKVAPSAEQWFKQLLERAKPKPA